MPRPAISEHTTAQLRNVIKNHRDRGKTGETYYLEAMDELARRTGSGLEFGKSLRAIHAAAAERRFLSYRDLGDLSGAEWSRVHYAVNDHLGDLMEYAYRKGWPLLNAIVVNKQNVETGEMDPPALLGFVEAALRLNIPITGNHGAFLRAQQNLVFAWGKLPFSDEPTEERGGLRVSP